MCEPGVLATCSGVPAATIVPPPVPPLRPEIDDPIRGLDHIEVVLDHEDGVPAIDQGVQDLEEHAHVLEVQAGRRFVQDVEGAAGVPLGEFGRELHALRLATGEGGRALAEVDVAEPDPVQRLQFVMDPRLVLEDGERVLDGELEHLADVHPTEPDVERLAIIALPAALLAGHVHVGEEVHLDLHEAVPLTGLAAPPLHVEGEAARAVPTELGLRHLGEELADRGEEPGVGRRIGARGAPDRGLVDVDDLVEMLEPDDAIVCAGEHPCPIEVAGEGALQDVLDEGALP